MALTGQELLDYACGQFESGAYDAALEAFILSYTKEYEREWVLENIYNCYMAGNEAEFQKNYELWNTGEKPAYENLTLDFIPYREGEYYIFDKEIQSFRGIFSMNIVNSAERQEDLRQMEFSALAVAMYWDWNDLPGILAEAGFHKIYVVCHDMDRCASFFKISELAEYAENIMLFSSMEEFQSYFHEHTSEYLPKLCIGIEDEKNTLLDIINYEHAYRLTPEGRNTDNVLLTIGIPTHDRGNLLLERLKTLRDMPYDAEVEFAVSKNGVNYYQEEYRQASELPDARLNYVGYDKELTMTENWQNVIKIAHGRFVMLVSDEDDVIIPALEHYFRLLDTHEGLGQVRPRTMLQYYSNVTENAYYKCGTNAFFGGLFGNNYLSGTIYNREMFLRANTAYWDENYAENEFYHPYPHMWWHVLMAFEGDYAVDTVICIREGDSVLQEEKQKYIKDGVDLAKDYETEVPELAVVSTYDARIKQFQGAVGLLWDFNKIDINMKCRALSVLANKTVYLMVMVYKVYSYKTEDFPMELERLVDEVTAVMEQWSIAREGQKAILNEMRAYMPAKVFEDAAFQNMKQKMSLE